MTLEVSQLRHAYIPSKTGDTKNLLILAHGRLGNLRILEWFAKKLELSDLSYLLIEAPFNDQLAEEDTPEKFGIKINQAMYSWYLDENKGLEESRKKINEMIEQIHSDFVPYQNIYWLGFSQGGIMGLDLFLRSKNKLGGLISVSASCVDVDSYPEAFGGFAKEQRVLITHGNRDENIPLEVAEEAYQKLHDLGVIFELQVYDKPHSFHLNKEIPYIKEKLESWMSS